LNDEDIEELPEKDELALYDEEKDIDKFHYTPRIERCRIKVIPPLVCAYLLLRHGL